METTIKTNSFDKNQTITNQKKRFFKKIEHNRGGKPFSSHEKGLFYKYMYELYLDLKEKADKLERIEKWLKNYDGSEYALVECVSIKNMLGIRSKAAIFRYDQRIKGFNTK